MKENVDLVLLSSWQVTQHWLLNNRTVGLVIVSFLWVWWCVWGGVRRETESTLVRPKVGFNISTRTRARAHTQTQLVLCIHGEAVELL